MRTRTLAAVALALACSAGAARKEPSLPRARVTVETASGAHSVAVEVARTDPQRALGLMNRPSLPDDAGMLFVFGDTDEHTFWMKNTLIPLDMIFIGEDGRVVGVVERAEPLTTSPRTVGKPSRYVLEVNGGWSAKRKVRPGDLVRFEGVL